MIRVNLKYIFMFIFSLVMFLTIGGDIFNSIFYINLILLALSSVYVLLINMSLRVSFKYKNYNYSVGDALKLSIILENKTPFPIPYIYLSSNEFNRLLYMSPFNKCMLNKNIQFNKRGIYKLDIINIYFKDIFNIWKIKKSINKEYNIKVYPRVYFLEEFIIKTNNLKGQQLNSNKRFNEQFLISDVRKYRIGDSLKKVHWKLSAKCGQILVKNFESLYEKEVLIFADLNDLTKNEFKKDDEEIINIFVSFINYLLKNKFYVKLFINGCEYKKIYLNSKENFNELLEYFLGNDYYREGNFINLIKDNIGKCENIIIFSLKQDKKLENEVQSIARGHNSIKHIQYKKIIKGEEYEIKKD